MVMTTADSHCLFSNSPVTPCMLVWRCLIGWPALDSVIHIDLWVSNTGCRVWDGVIVVLLVFSCPDAQNLPPPIRL